MLFLEKMQGLFIKAGAFIRINTVFQNYLEIDPESAFLYIGNGVFMLVSNITEFSLTLKAPITTAADDILKHFFIVFPRK